jgi:hypothetical protein
MQYTLDGDLCRYDKFSFDVTDALAARGGAAGSHELAVRVFDPTEFAHIPLGKQRRHPMRHPSSIWYTSSSGIWQTVWLEPVRASSPCGLLHHTMLLHARSLFPLLQWLTSFGVHCTPCMQK